MGTGGGLRVGRFLGIPIHADLSLFVTAGIVALAFLPRLEQIDSGLGSRKYLVALGFAFALYASILVHELAHAAVARAFGLPVRSVSLSMLGGLTTLDRKAETPGRDFAIAAAGPGATLLIALVSWLGLQSVEPGSVARLILFQLTASNVIVGIYNLLPGLPLDGGSMLADVVWKVTGRETVGQVVAGQVGRAVAVLTAAAPFLLGWVSGNAPDPVFIVWAAVIAYFLWAGSTAALRAATVRNRLAVLNLRSLIRPAYEVDSTLPLAESLRQLAENGARALVVVDRDGYPTGVVSEAAVSAVPVVRRPWVTVGEVARTIVPEMVLRDDLTGDVLLDALRALPSSEYLVVRADGSVAGVLSSVDLNAALNQG